MKKFLTLVSLVILTSCHIDEVRVMADRRTEITGTVNSPANSAITDLTVLSYGIQESFLTRLTSEAILGITSPEENGKFRFTSLVSENAKLVISINPEEYQGYRPNLESIYFYHKPGETERFDSYELGTIDVRKIKQIQITIRNTSQPEVPLQFELIRKDTKRIYLIENRVISEEPGENTYNSTITLLPENDNQVVLSFATLENSEVVIKYILNGEELEQRFNVSEANTYQFDL